MGSFEELLFIFVVALLVLGPKRLPEVGRTLGKTLAELKRATSGLKDSIESEMRNIELDRSATASATSRPKITETGNKLDGPKT